MSDHLLRAGLRLTLLSRSRRRLPPDLEALFEISGSRFLDRVAGVRAARRGVLAVEREGVAIEAPCTVAFNCTGHEINRDLLRILREAELLSEAEHRALQAFRPATVLDLSNPLPIAAAMPPLADALWEGRRGVRFAGTVFHVGGITGAGIMYSIETAKWAIGAMAGVNDESLPPPAAHLPTWFLEHLDDAGFPLRGQRWSDHLAAIVPVPVPTWSRGTKVLEGENGIGGPGSPVSRDTRALGEAREEALTALRDACYEAVPVAVLGEALELDRERLLWGLCTLWFNNGLTWLPPRSED